MHTRHSLLNPSPSRGCGDQRQASDLWAKYVYLCRKEVALQQSKERTRPNIVRINSSLTYERIRSTHARRSGTYESDSPHSCCVAKSSWRESARRGEGEGGGRGGAQGVSVWIGGYVVLRVRATAQIKKTLVQHTSSELSESWGFRH